MQSPAISCQYTPQIPDSHATCQHEADSQQQIFCEILFLVSRSEFEWRPRRKGGQVLFNLSHSDYEAGHVSNAA